MVLEKSDTGDIASKTLADRVWLLRLNLCQELCNLKVIPQTIYCFGLLILPQRVFPPVRLASVSLQVCFPSFLNGSPIMDLSTLIICVCFTGGIWLFLWSLFRPSCLPPFLSQLFASFFLCMFFHNVFPDISTSVFLCLLHMYSCVSQAQSPFLMMSGSFICLIFVSHHLFTGWLVQFYNNLSLGVLNSSETECQLVTKKHVLYGFTLSSSGLIGSQPCRSSTPRRSPPASLSWLQRCMVVGSSFGLQTHFVSQASRTIRVGRPQEANPGYLRLSWCQVAPPLEDARSFKFNKQLGVAEGGVWHPSAMDSIVG